ncbi:MAG: phenylacetate--CoA ligase [Gammaproteobacteria bacterium]|nr:phenylacetate--CoA ligase [Gammaproteobacteria bacterium]
MIDNCITANADFLDLKEIDGIQRANWRQQAAYLNQCSQFYQSYIFSGKLDEIVDLPFTDKEMLRRDQHHYPPFGSYLAADEHQISRMHRTSGTTGTAMNLALTAQDALMTASVGGRAQAASGLGPQHRVVHCLNYQLWMGGYTDHAALEATGAMVVPYGVGGTAGLIRTIQELKINAISCTPSYPAVLEQVIAKEFTDLTPRDLQLELGLFGGEAGLDDLLFRQKLENTWGFKLRNANYGVTDILCNFAGQSALSNDLHFVALDVLYPELIDADTGELKPWKEGESGELVLTHLCKQAQPLVRFRTNDMIVITGTDRAACGRTAPRFRVIGRSDDMIVVRGINVFPTMIAAVINQIEALSPEYRIVLNKQPPYDFLPVEVEQQVSSPDRTALAPLLEDKIKTHLGVSARVTILDPQSLPRTEGKTRRVKRNY